MDLHHGMPLGFRLSEHGVTGDLGEDLGPGGLREPPDGLPLPFPSSGIEYESQEPGPPGLEIEHAAHDVVRGVQGHEFARSDKDDGIRVLAPQRDGEAPADHIAEDIVQPDVHVQIVRSELPQGVERRQYPASGASYARLRSPGLGAQDPLGPADDDILELPLPDRNLADIIKDGALDIPVQQEAGGIVLRVASDLHDLRTGLRQGHGYVGRHRRFPDAALAVHRHLEHIVR